MELHSARESITFRLLQSRLLNLVNARIRNGEFSERGLATLLRVSQPQLHNVLKGARKLHAPLADAMLLKFQTSILDLLSEAELAVLEERIAEGLRNGEKHRLQGLRKRPGSFRRDRSEWEAS